MQHVHRIAPVAFFAAALLLAMALLDLGQALRPVNLGDVEWRVVAAGTVSKLLATPVIALLFAYLGGLLLERPGVLRGLSAFAGFLAVCLVLGTGAYALDAIQLRSMVAPEARDIFEFGLLVSFLKYGGFLIFLGYLCLSQWRAARSFDRDIGRRTKMPPKVVVKRPVAPMGQPPLEPIEEQESPQVLGS